MIESNLDVLETFILSNLQTYLNKYTTEDVLLTAPTSVIKDYPDFDKHTAKTVIYMLPDYFELEAIDVGGDLELTTRIKLYCFLRKDDTTTLNLQTLRQLKSMVEMLSDNPTLGDGVEDITLVGGDIFNDVEGDENIKGYKINLDLIDII